jgi:hypothetical protein
MMRYIFGILAVMVVIITAIVIIATRDSSNTEVVDQASRQIELINYVDKAATLKFTISGELNSEEEHNAIRISVSRNRRTLEILKGYSGRVATSRTWSNTNGAYENFLHALKNAGFSSSQVSEYESEKGVCPFGTRNLYELTEGNEEHLRLWSSSCDDSDGNFAGDDSLVRRLFSAQIPDYRELTKKIRL